MLRLFSIYILLTSFLIPSVIMEKCNKNIDIFFPNHLSKNHYVYKIDKTSKKNIQNSVKQKFFRDEVNVWEITSQDSVKYFAILDNVIGKTMPITFLTIFNSSSEVEDVSIIKYREPYGHEVKNKNWLNQFTSYQKQSNYKVGVAIDGISGATISVHSVSKGIHKLSYLIDDIIKKSHE